MAYPVVIDGVESEIDWTQETQKRLVYRLSSIDDSFDSLFRRLIKPKSRASGLFDLLWAVMTPAEFAKYRKPEDVFLAADEKTEAPAIVEAMGSLISEIFPTAQKKRTTKRSPSRK